MNPREHFLLPNTTASLPVPANDTADLKLTHFRPKGTSDHPLHLQQKQQLLSQPEPILPGSRRGGRPDEAP